MKKGGHEVVETANGKEAWDELQKPDVPSLVILDWMMPGMDGNKLCRAIGKDRSRGYVFIILMTARNSRQDIVTGLEAGAE